MTDAKPKALQLVEESENGDWIVGTGQWREEAATELRRLQWENQKLWEANAEFIEALKLAIAIIGHPDDQGSKFIAAAIAKAEVTK